MIGDADPTMTRPNTHNTPIRTPSAGAVRTRASHLGATRAARSAGFLAVVRAVISTTSPLATTASSPHRPIHPTDRIPQPHLACLLHPQSFADAGRWVVEPTR
jgi:hypothetical protein